MAYLMHRARWLALGVCIASTLLAFVAAQAQAGGQFLILGKTFAELGIEEETFTGESLESDPSFLLVGALGMGIRCERVQTAEGLLLEKGGENKGRAHIKLAYQECIAYLDQEPYPQIEGCGVEDFTISALLLVVLHSGEAYALAKPTGTFFDEIAFLGEECVLSGVPFQLSGTFAFWFVEKEVFVPLPTLASLDSLLSDQLMFGNHKATLDSEIHARLNGKFAEDEWSAF